MRKSRRTSVVTLLFAVLLALAASAASAGECPYSGASYTGIYASPIGLPRCIGSTVPKWSTCEVCLLGNTPYSDEQTPYTQSYTDPSGAGLQPRATFTQNGTQLPLVDGFFDGLTGVSTGQAIFRIRFTPTVDSGTISVTTTSPDTGLTLVPAPDVPTSFTAGNPAALDTGFLRRDPLNPGKFVWDNGTHPFIWGQTYYQIVERARAGQTDLWHDSVTNSFDKRMNKIRLLVSPWFGDPSNGLAESKAFQMDEHDANLNRDKLDILNWRALDQIPPFLKQKNIIADLILFHDGGDTMSPFAPGNTPQSIAQNQRYTRYTVARYAAFTNVIMTLANEYQLITFLSPDNDGQWTDLGCLIRGGCGGHSKGADPWTVNGASRRPLSIHNNINSLNPDYPCFAFFNSGWAGHISLQTNRGGNTPDFEASEAVRQNSDLAHNPCSGLSSSTRLPFINDEYYYIGTPAPDSATDRNRHRQAMWATAAGGGFGSTGSLKGPAETCPSCPPTFFTNWVNEAAYDDIKNLSDFFTTTVSGVWWQMTPSSQLTMVGGTRVYGLEGPGQNVVYAVKGPNSDPLKAKFKVTLPKGQYTATFYDTTNVAVPLKGADLSPSQEKRVTHPLPTPFMSPKKPGWVDMVATIVRHGGPPPPTSSAVNAATVATPDETVWVWDDLPAGAAAFGDAEGWNWIDDEPAAISDSVAHQSNLVAGMHQHYFQSASETLPVGTSDWLYAYIYLDPLNPPSEVMLQWNDGTWEHRAYWGANQIGLGIEGSNSRRYMGPLPLADRWIRLEVPASAVGLGGHTLNGMAFTLFNGKATWDEAGRASANMPQCTASAITQQPLSQTIVPGASATLSVAVSGAGPFNYQFYQSPAGTYNNPTGISTATINTGPLVATKPYWAEINDTCQGIFLHSDVATITVQCTAAPVITQPPSSRVTTPGQSTTLSVSASQAVSYQWYLGNSPLTGTLISGETKSTLTVAPQSTMIYSVRVINGCGYADSGAATVCVLPAITANPTPRTINPGQSTTLAVSAINVATYQWYVGTTPLNGTSIGGNSSSLLVTPLNTTNYCVRVMNSCGLADSASVTVTVAPPPPPQIARIQSVSVLANSQSSITGRWTQPTQPGTFLVAVVSGLKDPAQLQWTAPAGWQLAVVEEWTNDKVAIYYLANNAGARTSETFTVQQGYHDMTLYMLEYSGIMAVNPLDRTGFAGDFTNNGYVQTGFTANTVQPKELVITALSTYTQATFTVTPADGYTELYDQSVLYHLTTAMYEKITTSIGSYGHGATVSVPAEWTGVVATFRGANTN